MSLLYTSGLSMSTAEQTLYCKVRSIPDVEKTEIVAGYFPVIYPYMPGTRPGNRAGWQPGQVSRGRIANRRSEAGYTPGNIGNARFLQKHSRA